MPTCLACRNCPMDCNHFLHHYSDFRDDLLPDPSQRSAMEAHLADCSKCARYHAVMDSGAALLRELPGPTYRDDFRERLQHRLYLSELDPATEGVTGRGRALGVSNSVALGLAAAAILMVLVAWEPVVETVTPLPLAQLPAVSAAVPATLSAPRATRASRDSGSRGPAALVEASLWSESNVLLYEHSSLYHRNRGGALVQAGSGIH